VSQDKTVKDVIERGDIIKTSDGATGKVISVREHNDPDYWPKDRDGFGIVFVDKDAEPREDGSYRRNQRRYLNECRYEDGQVLVGPTHSRTVEAIGAASEFQAKFSENRFSRGESESD
jgi:hypothetical protein